MPGFVIHLACATEYMKKHNDEIKDKVQFFKGVIAPDITEKANKKNTHYGNSSSEVYLRQYLDNREIETDYDKGYFLHLVTDYIFYNKLLIYTSKEIYNDYDKLNKYLMEKYNVKLIDEVKDKVFFEEGETKILKREIAEEAIKMSSDNLLSQIKQEIMSTNNNEKWEKIKPLIRID